MSIDGRPADPARAAELISAVARHVEFDLQPLRAELLERLGAPSNECIWERAERIVEHAIDVSWWPEVVAQCERGLHAAREDFLVAAAQCNDAAAELQRKGRESWIAAAIRHRLAFDAAWRTLDERHAVEWLECKA